MMSLSTGAIVALYIVLFFLLIWAFITVGLLGAIAFALLKLRQQVDVALGKVDPLVSRTSDVLDTVQRVTMNVGDRTDSLLAKTEALADNLAQKVEGTASVVEKTVTSPLIGFSSLLAGLTRGFTVVGKGFSNINNRSSNGHRSDHNGQQ